MALIAGGPSTAVLIGPSGGGFQIIDGPFVGSFGSSGIFGLIEGGCVGRDIVFAKGAGRVEPLTIEDAAGALQDITVASSVIFTVKQRADETDANLIVKSVGSGITLTGPAPGQADILILATDTDALTPGKYKYDAFVTLPGSETEQVISGNFIVKSRVRT